MKHMLLIPFLLGFISHLNAEPIPKISDYEIEYKEGEKIEFRCPTKREKNKKTKKLEFTTLYEDCWFQLNDDHLNIMDRQKIKAKNIISYITRTDESAALTHIITYKDDNSQLKNIRFKASPKFWTGNYMKQNEKVAVKIIYWMRTKVYPYHQH